MPKPRADDYDLANRAEQLMDRLQSITEAFDGMSDTSTIVEQMRQQILSYFRSVFDLAVQETYGAMVRDVEAAQQDNRPPICGCGARDNSEHRPLCPWRAS